MKYWNKALCFFAFTLAIVAFYSSNEMVSAQEKSSDASHHDSAHHHDASHHDASHHDSAHQHDASHHDSAHQHDASHHAADMVKCPLCGMGIEGNENTDYQITFADGKTVSYLCPHCGLWEHAKHKDKIKSARGRDFISGEWKDVTTMYMLSNSSAVPACSPSWIAFGSKADIEKFQKGFGGTIYTFEKALKVRGAQPLGH